MMAIIEISAANLWFSIIGGLQVTVGGYYNNGRQPEILMNRKYL